MLDLKKLDAEELVEPPPEAAATATLMRRRRRFPLPSAYDPGVVFPIGRIVNRVVSTTTPRDDSPIDWSRCFRAVINWVLRSVVLPPIPKFLWSPSATA